MGFRPSAFRHPNRNPVKDRQFVFGLTRVDTRTYRATRRCSGVALVSGMRDRGGEDLVQTIAEDGEEETDFGIGDGLIGRQIGHDRPAARDGAGAPGRRAAGGAMGAPRPVRGLRRPS